MAAVQALGEIAGSLALECGQCIWSQRKLWGRQSGLLVSHDTVRSQAGCSNALGLSFPLGNGDPPMHREGLEKR